MTKRIKRIATIVTAGILLVCVSFASFAEGTEEIPTEYEAVAETAAEAEGSETEVAETVVSEEVVSETHEQAETAEIADDTAPDEAETMVETVETETNEAETAEETAVEETIDQAPEAEMTGEPAENTEEAVTEITENNTENTEENIAADPEENDETNDTEVSGETEDINETEDTENSGNADEPEESAEAGETEASDETEEPEETKETEASDEIEETDETGELNDEYYEFTDEDDTEYKELSEDAGYIDQAVVQQYIPEVTEELIASSGKYTTAEPETVEEENEPAETVMIRMWIAAPDGEMSIGDILTLKACSEAELDNGIAWEIRNELWERDVWMKIGEGSELELEITEEVVGNLIRFVTADGTASEELRIRAAERIEEDTAEDITEEPVAEDTAMADEDENRPKSVNEEPVTDEADDAEPAAEETETVPEQEPTEETEETEDEAAVIRAWITAAENEDGTVTMTAAADPELAGVNTWQTWDGTNEKWQKIGYGDQVTVEAVNAVYRFVMQDGTVSEEYSVILRAEETEAVEEVDETAETADEITGTTEETEIQDELETTEPEAGEPEEIPGLPEEIPELPEEIPELPEDRSITVTMTWEDESPSFGSVAHFDATLRGYEGFEYTLQWMESTDNENWTEVTGATDPRLDVVITEENYTHYWRVEVSVLNPEDEAL